MVVTQGKASSPTTATRRITQEHRTVYRVCADAIDFLQAGYHWVRDIKVKNCEFQSEPRP